MLYCTVCIHTYSIYSTSIYTTYTLANIRTTYIPRTRHSPKSQGKENGYFYCPYRYLFRLENSNFVRKKILPFLFSLCWTSLIETPETGIRKAN